MAKRYAKYDLFLFSRDYLAERATMLGNECFMIIYVNIYRHKLYLLYICKG